MCRKDLKKELSKITNDFVGGVKRDKYSGLDYLCDEIIQVCKKNHVNQRSIRYCIQTLANHNENYNYKIYPCFKDKKGYNRYSIYCKFEKLEDKTGRYYRLVKAEPFMTI